MAISTRRRLVFRTKREIAERALGQALGMLGNNPRGNAKYVSAALDYIARGEKQKAIRDWAHGWLAEGKPGQEFLVRMLKNTHPSVRRRFIARMIISMMFREPELDRQAMEQLGFTPPYTMIVSPTMRCNYRCRGCYAASYERKDDMSPELFDRILGEAEEIGIDFISLVGGEPFLYPELFDIIAKHDKSFFQIFTNGSFIDRAMAEKLAEMGNIGPQISVNGPREHTDASRGQGAFDRVCQTMDNLREAGCVFGFSSLITRSNMDAICSEEWIDFLIEKGALYGWFFLYMPVGDNPDINLMPTPQQREQLRQALKRYQDTKPILFVDFWNYGPVAGGCISGGRCYFHVNHRGDVEPCIFCHFATHNVNNCTLVEALASPFFKSIRDSQPFGYNTLLPCPMLDYHQAMWSIIQQHGAKPTHEGADKMFTTFEPEMAKYSAGVREIMDKVWETEGFSKWAPQWTLQCGIPAARLESRRQEFEASRKRS